MSYIIEEGYQPTLQNNIKMQGKIKTSLELGIPIPNLKTGVVITNGLKTNGLNFNHNSVTENPKKKSNKLIVRGRKGK